MAEQESKGISKRVAVASAAIGAIAASSDFRAQVCISVVAIVFVLADTLIKWLSKSLDNSDIVDKDLK